MLAAYVLAAVALGLLSAVAWVVWAAGVVDKHPTRAALADGAIILPGLLVKQMWAQLDSNFIVFAGYLVGSVLGTYLAVRHNKQRVR
jgi:hypothetical protein